MTPKPIYDRCQVEFRNDRVHVVIDYDKDAWGHLLRSWSNSEKGQCVPSVEAFME